MCTYSLACKSAILLNTYSYSIHFQLVAIVILYLLAFNSKFSWFRWQLAFSVHSTSVFEKITYITSYLWWIIFVLLSRYIAVASLIKCFAVHIPFCHSLHQYYRKNRLYPYTTKLNQKCILQIQVIFGSTVVLTITFSKCHKATTDTFIFHLDDIKHNNAITLSACWRLFVVVPWYVHALP